MNRYCAPICRLLLAVVFAAAAIAKLADPSSFAATLLDAGIPSLAARVLGAAVPGIELALAAALLLGPRQRLAHWMALGVLSMFTVFLIVQQLRGGASCGCFGRIQALAFLSGGVPALVRNGVLLTACALLLRSKPSTGGSLDHHEIAKESSRA